MEDSDRRKDETEICDDKQRETVKDKTGIQFTQN